MAEAWLFFAEWCCDSNFIKNRQSCVDIEPLVRSYKGCSTKATLRKTDPKAYELWKQDHFCKVNSTGTAENMEPIGAKRIESVQLKKMDYAM
jgi:hypothetical protein